MKNRQQIEFFDRGIQSFLMICLKGRSFSPVKYSISYENACAEDLGASVQRGILRNKLEH